jgi:hypothetical protein
MVLCAYFQQLVTADAGFDVDLEGYCQFTVGGAHFTPEQRSNLSLVCYGYFDNQFVVYLEEQACAVAVGLDGGVDPQHGQLHDVGGGGLDGVVDGFALGGLLACRLILISGMGRRRPNNELT